MTAYDGLRVLPAEAEPENLGRTPQRFSPSAQRAVLSSVSVDGSRLDFQGRLAALGQPTLCRSEIEIFQINLGKLCNMSCRHCHVDAGPDRSDAMMDAVTVEACLRALERTGAHTVDLTGGAPELHPQFRYIVESARARGKHVIDRCNLTVLLTRRMEDLPEWLAHHEVEVVCSLPHYAALNTDTQRGEGTFSKSIEALRRLNAVGYGQGDPRRRLTLMSNPAGAFLAAPQASVEADWRRALTTRYGVSFDRLFALNNMPISRFLEWLTERDQLETYMTRLTRAFNPAAVDGLMCKNTLSVSWDGYVYDCDFNQMLDMKVSGGNGGMRIDDFDPHALGARSIRTGTHCFGCTAGAGSSCSGATTPQSDPTRSDP